MSSKVSVRRHPTPRVASGPVVLTLSHQSPWPSTAGNEYRIRDMIEAISESGYRCIPVICPLEPDAAERVLPVLLEQGVEFVLCDRSGQVVDVAVRDVSWDESALGRVVETRDWEQARARVLGPALREKESPFTTPLMRAALRRLLAKLPVDAVIANYAFAAGLLDQVDGPLKVVDTHDVLSQQLIPTADGTPSVPTLTVEQERTLLAEADVVVAIQEREADVLRAVVPGSDVVTCGVSFPYRPLPPPPGEPPTFVVMGSDNALNVAGLRGLLRGTWPLVLRQVPTARLAVAGRLSAHVPAWAPNVDVLGVVADPVDAYDRALAAVNPTSVGTGLKIKTLEALSFGRPVVCWPAGADGIAGETEGMLVAQDAKQFAAHLVRLCATPPASVPAHDSTRRSQVYAGLLTRLRGQRDDAA